jgi:flagellar FliJ protein
MKGFAFRFQRILDLKESLEEARKIALGEVIAVLNREQELLTRLQQTRRRYQQAGQTLPAARLHPGLLGLHASYLLRLEREIGEQQEHIRRVEAIVADRRQKLMEATRERRVYEILKEKAREAHQREVRRQEQIRLDEVGEQLYVRRENEDARVGVGQREW